MLRGLVSYWVLPLFSALVWLAMLLSLFLFWVTTGKPRYSTQRGDQHVPYISDIGADKLKPLFIAMGSVSVIVFDLAFVAERWLRHLGRLTRNSSTSQKALSILSIIFALIGGAGLILLTIFDTKRYHDLHDVFLCLFIGGYVISAVFICAQYQRLGIHFREFRILRISFWIKLFFILIEVALAIAFGVSNKLEHYNVAGSIEWVIALVYTFYVMSFVIDFLPAVQSGSVDPEGPTEEEMAVADSQNVLLDRSTHAHGYRGTDLPPSIPPFAEPTTASFLSPHENLVSHDETRKKSIGDSSEAT